MALSILYRDKKQKSVDPKIVLKPSCLAISGLRDVKNRIGQNFSKTNHYCKYSQACLQCCLIYYSRHIASFTIVLQCVRMQCDISTQVLFLFLYAIIHGGVSFVCAPWIIPCLGVLASYNLRKISVLGCQKIGCR